MIPWRYIVPRRNFRTYFRVARKCPEIAWHMDQHARVHLVANLIRAALLIPRLVLIVPYVIGRLAQVGLEAMERLMPEHPDHFISAAHRVLPIDEINRRIARDR